MAPGRRPGSLGRRVVARAPGHWRLWTELFGTTRWIHWFKAPKTEEGVNSGLGPSFRQGKGGRKPDGGRGSKLGIPRGTMNWFPRANFQVKGPLLGAQVSQGFNGGLGLKRRAWAVLGQSQGASRLVGPRGPFGVFPPWKQGSHWVYGSLVFGLYTGGSGGLKPGIGRFP